MTRGEAPRAERRFEVLRSLGRGGFGTVELVQDHRRRELVARKRLRAADPTFGLTLKRELRVARALDHPNLVRVLELGEDDDGRFLLMEHVAGEEFDVHCAGPRWDRLAGALPQLLSALSFLHAHGIAHADLKPQNVLVRNDGLLKVLDFGLSVFEGETLSGGTLDYLAPERRRGAPPSSAADRWAVGCMLRAIIPAELRPELDEPIEALLRDDPARRPSMGQLESSLLPLLGTSADAFRAAPGPVLGRDALVARVHGSLLAGRRSITLTGPPGIGKSTLAREVVVRAEASGFIVLSARAYREARLPINVLDDLLDLATERVDTRDPYVRRALEAIEATFPAAAAALGDGQDTASVRRVVHARLFGKRRAPSHAQLAAGVGELLSSMGPRVLLCVDDLQWADGDSQALIARVLEGSPNVSLLATSRTASGSLCDALDVVVPLLPRAVIESVLAARGHDPHQAASLAEHAAGSVGVAVLAEQLSVIRRGGLDGAEVDERSVLAAVVVAGRPLHRSDLPSLAVDALCQRGLLSRSGDEVDLTHHVLREPLVEALGPDWIRAAHARRARELADKGGQAADLVRHLLATGETEGAASLAPAAAREAGALGAHALAAELYDVAHRHSTFDVPLAETRAVALERARRLSDAADAWAELASRVSDSNDVAHYALCEAVALLGVRRIGEGRARLDAALELVGESKLERRGVGALWPLVRFVSGPLDWPLRSASRMTSRDADRFLRSASVVGYFDTSAGLALLMRLRHVFDRDGDAERAAWCDYLLAFFAMFARMGRLAARYRRAAQTRLAGATPVLPMVAAFPRFLDAYAALRAGAFSDARAVLDETLASMEGTRDEHTFEVQLSLSLRTSAVFGQQNVDDAEAAVARFEAVAQERPEVAIQCHVNTARALALVWRGRFEESLDAMDRLRNAWPREPLTMQSILIEAYAALPALLLGDGRGPRRRLREALERGRRLRIWRTAYGPIVAAIAALAEIVSDEGDLRRAGRWAAFAASQPSPIRGLGDRIVCYLDGSPLREASVRARKQGQPLDQALALLIDAIETGDSARAAAARLCLGELGASPRLAEESRIVRRALERR